MTASLKLVRYMEEQGKEWQPAASLRELAALSELKRDAVKVNVAVLLKAHMCASKRACLFHPLKETHDCLELRLVGKFFS